MKVYYGVNWIDLELYEKSREEGRGSVYSQEVSSNPPLGI